MNIKTSQNKKTNMECKYCKKTLKTVSSLNLHQKRATKCIKIQMEMGIITNVNKYLCDCCGSEFLRKSTYERHLDTCDNTKYSELLEKYNNLEKKYKLSLKHNKKISNKLKIANSKIESMIKVKPVNPKVKVEQKKKIKPKIITNNITNNNITNNNITHNHHITNNIIFNKTEEDVNNIIEKEVNMEMIAKGLKGMSRVTIDKILKNPKGQLMINITDKSRMNANFKNSDGVFIKDEGMRIITGLCLDKFKRYTHRSCRDNFTMDLLNEDSLICKGREEIISATWDDYARELCKNL